MANRLDTRIVHPAVSIGLACICTLYCETACLADQDSEKFQPQKLPNTPIVLLVSAAKLRREKTWTTEIRSEEELERTLRAYINGIARDCHEHQADVSAANQHWLRDLLARRKMEGSRKAHYVSLAGKDTVTARDMLVRFAGKHAVQVIDDTIEKFEPPRHHNYFWQERHGDPPAPSGVSFIL